MRPLLGNRIFGCDDCQLCCPWNKFAQATDEGDFTTIGVTRTVDTGGAGTGDNPGDTWPSTFPADNGTTYSDVFKIRLDYTPSGPSGSLLTRQRGMSGGMAELTGGMRG